MKFGQCLAGGRIDHLAGVAHHDVNPIGRDDIVRTARVGAGNVDLIVSCLKRCLFVGLVKVDVIGSQILEFAFPQHPARVDIAGGEQIHSLNDQSAPDHLLGRTMAMPRQHIGVTAAAKP